MCTEQQHQAMMLAFKRLEEIAIGRTPVDNIVMISSTQAYIIDYRDRRHIFVWSPNTLTLTIEELGIVTIPQETWVNLGFTTGMKVFASGQASSVPIFVRCTDEVVA